MLVWRVPAVRSVKGLWIYTLQSTQRTLISSQSQLALKHKITHLNNVETQTECVNPGTVQQEGLTATQTTAIVTDDKFNPQKVPHRKDDNTERCYIYL